MKENPKHTDHHFKPLNEYKYNLIEVEPRKLSESEISILGWDQAFDLIITLEKLIEGSEILLNQGYDGHGHEIISQCVKEGKLFINKINNFIEAKYNMEPRKSYEELQKENEALKLTFQVLKTASELFSNVQKLGATFQKGGITNNSEGL